MQIMNGSLYEDLSSALKSTTAGESITDNGTRLNLSSVDKGGAPEGCVVIRFADYIPWDNPDNIINQDQEKIIETFVNGVSLPLLTAVCTVTNMINMIVFYKHGLKERINLTLFALALCDLLYVLQSATCYSDRLYLIITKAPSRYGPSVKTFTDNKLVGLYGISWASQFLTTIIACERCFCVVSPIRAHSFIKTRTMALIICLACAGIVGLFFVVGFRWSVKCVYNPLTGTAENTIYPSDFYFRHRKLVDTLDGVVYGLSLPIIYVVVVTTATVITAVKLKKMAAWREQSSSAASLSVRDVTLTRMLIGTSILFVVTAIPGIGFRTAILFTPDLSLGGRYRNTFNSMLFLSLLLTYVNSSLNFFIYYRFGTKFRETVRLLFGRFAQMTGKREKNVKSTRVNVTEETA